MRVWVGLAITVVAGQAAVFAAVAAPQLRASLWGAHAWTYLGPVGLSALVVTALAVGALLLAAPPFPERGTMRVGLAILAGPLFYLLRDQTHLLGDGRLWISVLGGSRAYHAHEPLAFAGSALATAGMSGAAPSAVATRVEIYSVLLGMVAVYLMMGLAGRIGRCAPERWFVFALLAISGTIQFGFGYVEAYPLLWVAVLAYLWAALSSLGGGVSLVLPAFVLGGAAAVHGSAVLLLPSFLCLGVLARPRAWEWVASAAAVLALPALAYGLLPSIMTAPPGADPGESSAVAGVVRLFSELRFYQHGVVPWVMNQLSRWTLAAPLTLGLVAGGILARSIRGSRGEPGMIDSEPPGATTFLLLAAIALLFPLLVLDTEASRGSALDWDSFAMAAVPLAAAAGFLWASRLNRSRAVRFVLVAGTALAFAGTGAFVLVNAQTARAIERYHDLMDSPRWADATRAMAAENLAIYHRDDGNAVAAERSYLLAWELNPGNQRLGRNAAAMLSRNGNHQEAVGVYRRLLERTPADVGLWLSAGREMEWAAQPDSARIAYREAIRRDPERVEAYNRLSRLVAMGGGREEARRLLLRSLELAPDQPRAAELRRVLEELGRD